jgi:hypothetical protein
MLDCNKVNPVFEVSLFKFENSKGSNRYRALPKIDVSVNPENHIFNGWPDWPSLTVSVAAPTEVYLQFGQTGIIDRGRTPNQVLLDCRFPDSGFEVSPQSTISSQYIQVMCPNQGHTLIYLEEGKRLGASSASRA